MSGLIPPEHEHSAAIDEAVIWLRETPRHLRPGPVVKQLQQRFGLNAADACLALREHEAALRRAT